MAARALLAVACLGLCGPASAAEADLAARIAELETQVLQLRGRVAALEAGGTTAPVAGETPSADDGLVWTFAGVADGSPFSVTHKGLDRPAGRVDLLLRVVAPLPRPADWVAVGAPVPLTLTVRDARGGATRLPLVLARGTRTGVGAQLHLVATLDPALAAAARQLVIEPSGDWPTDGD